ncbi:MAG: hypothetical protein GX957_03640 [Clostridiaceae bacterium]|nr:hypothetical protein [Clostridiaceae bacterium]
MTLKELYTYLLATNMPVAYHSFKSENKEVPPLPYIVFFATSSNNFSADNKVYSKSTNCRIELYTENKSIQSEEILEAALDAASIFYDKTESYIESEEMFQIAYQINI